MKFKVYFNEQFFAQFDSDVNACKLACDMHQISNVKHTISVIADYPVNGTANNIILSFVKE